MQNAEEWDLNYYLRDLADEIARHAFNTGRYPEINYITGNAGPDTPTETNQDGVLNVYIPQGINPQQFQQALDEYIKKNGSVLMYQESQCNVQVVQCPSTKEDAQKEIQAFNAAQHGTAYYRLINGPNNSLYIMKCEAQTPEIKEQIQQQFENQNGYYYSQTNTYTPNSYESNSKESKYITALKMFYFTGIMPQRLPQPDQDDEEQQKLYDVCRYLSSYASQVHYDFCYNIMLNKFKNKQADLDDDEFKKCGIEICDLYDRSASQINQQSLLPIQVSQVPALNQYVNSIYPQYPAEELAKINFFPQPVEIPLEISPNYDPTAGKQVQNINPISEIDPYYGPTTSEQVSEDTKYYSNVGMKHPEITSVEDPDTNNNMNNAQLNNVNMPPYDLDANNANNNDAKFTLTEEDFKKNINNNGNIRYI